MRRLGLFIMLLGALLAASPWLPVPWIGHVPYGHWAIWGAAGILLLIGWTLSGVRRRSLDLWSDQGILAELRQHDFHMVTFESGWHADGVWQGAQITIGRQGGYQANRFGRPWVLIASIPGVAAEPWPLVPEQSRILDRGPDGFTVVIADLGRRGNGSTLAQRLDQIFSLRTPPVA